MPRLTGSVQSSSIRTTPRPHFSRGFPTSIRPSPSPFGPAFLFLCFFDNDPFCHLPQTPFFFFDNHLDCLVWNAPRASTFDLSRSCLSLSLLIFNKRAKSISILSNRLRIFAQNNRGVPPIFFTQRLSAEAPICNRHFSSTRLCPIRIQSGRKLFQSTPPCPL